MDSPYQSHALYPIPLSQLDRLIREAISSELDKRADPDRNAPMTPAQAAEYLQVSKVTLFNWERQGKLIPVRRGGKVWYTKAMLEAFLKP